MDIKNLFDNFSDALCVFSNENRLIYRNKSFCNAFSDFKSVDKFKKRFNCNLSYLFAEDLKNETPIDLLLKSKENFHTVCTYQNKNDEYKYYYIYTFMYNESKIVVFKDISESERAEYFEKSYLELKKSYDIIKESTEKFEKLKEQAQAQMLKMGIINRISLVIRETNDIKKIIKSALSEIHELLGSFKTYFSFKEKNHFKPFYSVLGDDVDFTGIIEYEKAVIESINNKNITVNTCLKECVNTEEIMPKGVRRIIIPIYDKNKLLGIITTLTKQKFNEKDNREMLQSIAVQLSGAIVQADLINELDKKNKKLGKTLIELKDTQIQLINTEKMASVGQLVAGVAHEINTPLSAINSNNTMISKIINSKNPIADEQIEILKELNFIDIEATKRISDIVKSLKRFVRLDESELQEADINNELDLTLKLVAHEVKKNTKIIKNYGNIPPVKCYVNMLNQVFMNLLVNASQSIRADKKDGIIEITTENDEKNLVIKIKDNGCGISNKNKNKVFTAGFTTKKAGIGTGLGLSISKKIIEIHKGTINFKSKENEGSEFVIALPLKSGILNQNIKIYK